MGLRKFKLFRGDADGGIMENYSVEVDKGMVVLDVIHRIQAQQAGDLAVRSNCKAGKCGSCSVEINGKPKLACMTRMNEYNTDETISVRPLKTFPLIKDLVSDVSWNYKQNKNITPFTPDPNKKNKNGDYVMMQEEVDRVQRMKAQYRKWADRCEVLHWPVHQSKWDPKMISTHAHSSG